MRISLLCIPDKGDVFSPRTSFRSLNRSLSWPLEGVTRRTSVHRWIIHWYVCRWCISKLCQGYPLIPCINHRFRDRVVSWGPSWKFRFFPMGCRCVVDVLCPIVLYSECVLHVCKKADQEQRATRCSTVGGMLRIRQDSCCVGCTSAESSARVRAMYILPKEIRNSYT